MRKLLSLLLAAVMVMSMIVPMSVSATGSDEPDYGTLVFEENFNDSSKAQMYLNNAVAGGNNPTAVGEKFKIENGVLKVDIAESTVHGREGMRIPLYAIPDNYTEYTVVSEINWNGATNKDGYSGVGLIYADDLVRKTGSAGNFYMYTVEPWYCNRLLGWNNNNTFYGVAAVNPGTSAQASNLSAASVSSVKVVYTVSLVNNTISVSEYTADGTLRCEVSDATKNVDKVVGLWLNDIKAEIDYVKVYANGVTVTNTASEFTGAQVEIGETLAMEFAANIADKDINANNKVEARVTFDGKPVETAVAVASNGTASFTVTGIAPNQMDKEIVAELYVDGTKVDTETTSVKANLTYLISNSQDADVVKFAKDALVYGGAAQAYNGDPDTINGGAYSLIASSRPTDAAVLTNSVGSKTEITAAGLYFDYVNKIYFKIDGIENATKITINDDEVELAEKVYTDEIFASALDENYTIKVYVGDTVDSEITYSVYDYIARKWDSATIGNLAKALYNYAESAKLVP